MKSKFMVTLLLLTVMFCGCNIQTEAQVAKTKKEIYAFNTITTITVYGKGTGEALQAAEEEIKRLEQLFSVSQPGSDVSKINAVPENRTAVSSDVLAVIQKATEISKKTEGAFDISLYPVIKGWGFTTGAYAVPSESKIDQWLKRVDYRAVQVDESAGTVQLKADMAIDLGGIAKGYISAKVARVLQDYGVESGIVNIGGNVQIFGKHPEKENWEIAVEYAEKDTTSYLGVLQVNETAVITSGAYQRYFEEKGETYHHIFDSKTGKPAQSDIKSVTVVCEDAALGDGLSTALFVMGTEKAVEYYKQNPDFDFIILNDKNNVVVSSTLSHRFTLDETYSDYKIIVI